MLALLEIVVLEFLLKLGRKFEGMLQIVRIDEARDGRDVLRVLRARGLRWRLRVVDLREVVRVLRGFVRRVVTRGIVRGLQDG